jgi:outer membrane immunogenic protein
VKKHYTGLLAFALTSVAAFASANAADLAVKAPVYKALPVVYPSWAGFYLGAHVGGAWSSLDVTNFDEEWPIVDKFKNKGSALFGGGTAGYNFQTGNLVYGVELDVGSLGLSHSKAEPIDTGIISSVGSGLYLDATARLGYAFDNVLVYAKGGYAFYNGSISVTDVGEQALKVSGFNGWTVGGGVEYKFAPAWSVKAEYQFFDFGTSRLIMNDGDRYDNSLTTHTLKAGLNYHF